MCDDDNNDNYVLNKKFIYKKCFAFYMMIAFCSLFAIILSIILTKREKELLELPEEFIIKVNRTIDLERTVIQEYEEAIRTGFLLKMDRKTIYCIFIFEEANKPLNERKYFNIYSFSGSNTFLSKCIESKEEYYLSN